MPSSLHVYLLPALVPAGAFAGRVVAVIDVLRATTTIATALANGAREVIPCLEVEDARAAALRFPVDTRILGGERGGLPIEGFDLGNSPAEYTPERVRNRTIFFTTTNGTRAMMECREARRVLIAGFVNAQAILRELVAEQELAILCAGTRGAITREDALLAGLLVEKLAADAARELNDQARLARDAWQAAKTRGTLADELRDTQGGRNLASIGLAADIVDAARLDRYDFVPELDLRAWSIRPAGPASA